MNRPEIFSVGHSTLSYDAFRNLIGRFSVNAIADVRSFPFSRHFPQFNRDELKGALRSDGIPYVFLGDELGGRPKDTKLYCNGVADYEKMANAEGFRKGIHRLTEGVGDYKIAMMCSERNPMDCHRCLLIGRVLSGQGVTVKHILGDGRFIIQSDIEKILLELINGGREDLFEPADEALARAYRTRSMKIAYIETKGDNKAVLEE